MRKGLVATMALTLVLGFVGYTVAQQVSKNPPGGRLMVAGEPMGRHHMGHMGDHGRMGPGMGMMGPMGGGMGMMGPMMGSPEIMGTMMSIHGDIMSLTGEMMQKYGATMGQMTPELRRQMQQQMMEQMGEILTKHGNVLKQRAKAAGK
jgi:hypothetical protein